jgi:hypothetical protein
MCDAHAVQLLAAVGLSEPDESPHLVGFGQLADYRTGAMSGRSRVRIFSSLITWTPAADYANPGYPTFAVRYPWSLSAGVPRIQPV